MGEKKKVRGSLDTVYIAEDYAKEIDLPRKRSVEKTKTWKIYFERDEFGNPIIKNGYAKAYAVAVIRRKYYKNLYPDGLDENLIPIGIMYLSKLQEGWYYRVRMALRRDKIKILPTNIDERFVLIKDKNTDVMIDEEIW